MAHAVVVGFVHATEGAKPNKAKNIRRPGCKQINLQRNEARRLCEYSVRED